MSFVARLRPELIRVAPPWRTFTDTITGLVAMLAAAGALPADSEAAAISAVTAREASASTALLDIYAGVPHARLAGLARPALAVAVSSSGLYEAVPIVPIQIVALVLSPPEATAAHLRVVAGIATLLRSSVLRAALLAAPDGAEALAALRQHAGPTPEPWRHGSHLPGDVLVERSSLDLDRIGPGEAIDNAIRRRKGEGGTVCLEGLPDIRLSGPRRTALDP